MAEPLAPCKGQNMFDWLLARKPNVKHQYKFMGRMYEEGTWLLVDGRVQIRTEAFRFVCKRCGHIVDDYRAKVWGF